MPEKICMHFIVTGRVQGVFYRSHTQEYAQSLQLTGWIQNRSDGAVELVACGELSQLKALEIWLWDGPRFAEVNHVHTTEIPWTEYQNFDIKY
jgi:acylphosphatase